MAKETFPIDNRGLLTRVFVFLVVALVAIFLYAYLYNIPIQLPTQREGIEIPQRTATTTTTQIITQPEGPSASIVSFETTQAFYKSGQRATVNFIIKNDLNVPYNMNVDWIYGGKIYPGWQSTSTKFYKTDDVENQYYSDYRVFFEGDWETKLVIDYTYQGVVYSKEASAKFKVI